MNRLLSVGRRFSRASLLCIGGVLILMAIGGLVGNLPSIRDVAWKPDELKDVYVSLFEYAILGVIFVIVAYGIYRSREWGAYGAALAAFSSLVLIGKTWLKESSDPDAAIVFLVPGALMAIILVWALSEIRRTVKEGARLEGRNNQIA